MRAFVRLLFTTLVFLCLLGTGAVQAAPDQVVYGPKVFSRTGKAPNSSSVSFTLPADVVAPYLLRIENGQSDGSKRSSSASVSVNGVQVAGPNDFNQKVGALERDVALTPSNTLEVRLAGTPGSQLTLTILGTQPKPVPVSVSPNPLTLNAGATGQLTVSLSPKPKESGKVTLSSDAPLVAGVPSSVAYGAGDTAVPVTVSGLATGSAVVTASANGGSASGTVQVSPGAATVSSLLPTSLTLTQGSNGLLKLTLSAAQSSLVRVDLASSDATIATVPQTVSVPAGATGAEVKVSAIAPGTAQISAKLNNTSAASQVTVTPAAPTLVSLLPATSTVTLGANVNLQLTLSAAQATATDVPLTVSPDGLVNLPSKVTIPAGQTSATVSLSTLALGTAGIGASLNGTSVAAAVHIVPPAPAIVSLLPSPLTVTQDASGSLTVKLNAQQQANTEVTLATDAPTLLKLPASVIVPAGELSASFSIVGLAVGNAQVTATVNGTSQTAQVAVTPYPPQPVSLLPDPLPLQEGASGTLTLTINAAQFGDTAFAVSNSAASVVQAPAQVVVPAGKLKADLAVSGLAEGSATLGVALNGASTQAAVSVTPPPPVPASVEPAQLTLAKGVPGTLKLTVSRAPATTTAVSVASSDALVAEVPATVTIAAGALTAEIPVIARSEGNAKITAGLNGGSVTAAVTVTAPAINGLTLSPLLPTVFPDETVAFMVQGTYTDASVADVTSKTAWSSSAPGIASIASTGVATALSAGSTTITASFEGLKASTPLKVEAVPQLGLSPSDASVKVDGSASFTVSSSAAAPAGGLAVTLSAAGTGTVTVPASVTIPAGQTSVSFTVGGTAVGDVTLTASVSRYRSATAQIQVVPKIQITGLSPTSGPLGTAVTITGSNFDATAANNEVRFNGERAVIGTASATQLIVVVPTKATTGAVTVTNSLGTATGPTFMVQLQQDFDITLSPASLKAPPGGTSTTRVILQSKGLSDYAHAATLAVTGLPSGMTAKFDRATVYLGGESSLQLSVPSGFTAGTYALTIQATGSTEQGSVTRSQTLAVEVLPPGSTTVSGRVLHAEDDSPFVGARIRLGGDENTTDASGYYRFYSPALTGDQVILIDGHTANTETTRYASAIAMPVYIATGKDNTALTSYISAVDASKSVTITPGVETSVKMADLPNYSLNIPAGAILYGWDGTPVTQVSVRTIPPDRLPIKPLPDGVAARSVYLYYFFREGGANPTQKIPVTMINDLDALPGEKVTMWYYDESTTPDANSNQWREMGSGTVSADGKSIVSDPGVGIPKFCCGATTASRSASAAAASNTGPNAADNKGPKTGPKSRAGRRSGRGGPPSGGDDPGAGPGTGPKAGPKAGPKGAGDSGDSGSDTGEAAGDGDEDKTCKPVDLGSGNNLPFEHRGFGIDGLLPVNINCQYRSTDPRIGLFGRGTSFAYDWSAAVSGDTVVVVTPAGVKYSLAKEADGVYRANTGKSGALGWEVRSISSGRVLRFPQGGEMEFNSAGNLVVQRNTSGQKLSLALDSYGYVKSITDGNGRGYEIKTTIYTSGRTNYPLISSVTDSLGRTVSYSYDSVGRLATHTDAASNVTRYEYDANNRVSKRVWPDGSTITFQYDGAGRTTKEVLEDGSSSIQYAYQTVGGLVTQTTLTDPLGRQTEYRFNGQGYVTRVTDALGRVTSKTLDPATNLVTAVTDPAGRMTRYAYDAKGKVTQITDPAGNVTKFEYDATWNKPTKITDALGRVSTSRYGEKGQLVETVDPSGAVRKIAYTPQLLPQTVTDPLGRNTYLDYDGDGNLVSVTNPMGQTAYRRYDEANRLIETSDPLGYSTSYSWDALDRMIEVVDANKGTTKLAYDALDRLTSFTDPRGNPVERRTYNLRGFLTQILDAADQATTYEYDAAGNRTKITDRKGLVTTVSYDAINRPVQVQTADGQVISTEYDLAGNISAVRDNRSGDLLFIYDVLRRPIQVVSDLGSVEYAYDALGRRTQRTINGQDPTNYQYDAAGRLTRIEYRGKSTVYAYDTAGRLTSKTLPNGMKGKFEYDDADRVLAIRYERADGSLLEKVAYGYDAAGHRTKREATVAGTPETPVEATYDGSNRLATLSMAGQNYVVAYDANGNLTSRTGANGEVTTYTWDAFNRLAGIASESVNASFQYDALGRRTSKTVNGSSVQYLYDGIQAIAEIRGNAITANLLTGLAIDEVIARYTSEGERSLLTDVLGSVLISATEKEEVATAYGYSPYGETQTFGTAEGNAVQYTGRENDSTGLYFYRARYYDPELKRFMSEDPIGIGGGINTHSYVEGDPLSKVDRDGRYATIIIGAIGGFTFDLFWQLAHQCSPSLSNVDWGEVAASTAVGGVLGAVPALGAGGIAAISLGGTETVVQGLGAFAGGYLGGVITGGLHSKEKCSCDAAK